MDRNTIIRWFVIAGGILLFMKYGWPLMSGKGDTPQAVAPEMFAFAPDFARDPIDPPAEANAPAPLAEETCKLQGNRYLAELSTRGAALTHLYLRDAQYAAGSVGFDMSTTPDVERWRSLRADFRTSPPLPNEQVKYDRFNWKLATNTPTECVFTYEDADVALTKTIKPTARPFELSVDTSIKNLANTPKSHRFMIEDFAFRADSEVKGRLGRVSPFQTELSCARDKDVVRKSKDDFKEGWFSEPLVDRYAAVSNYYFTQALIPADGGPAPECGLLAEEGWYTEGPRDSDHAANVYQAHLAYPTRELAPQGIADYKQIAFFGPKERPVLAAAAGGKAKLGDVINLGLFSPVAKVLVAILDFFHDHVTFGNWGLAIIAMTICLRVLLFPLSLQQIKTSLAMRKLKPELDALNKKFAGDAQAKQLGQMELYRKNGVNPLGGCLPQLVQMPVWFAMYTTLQTAVEMYHTRFLWFSDLSAPDHFFILPFVLGGFTIVQQRIVPQQGMDPMQQKMMTYLIPIVFTVMMLFLPAALGLYMLTSSILNIVQQLVVQKVGGTGGGSGSAKKGDIVVRPIEDDRAATA